MKMLLVALALALFACSACDPDDPPYEAPERRALVESLAADNCSRHLRCWDGLDAFAREFGTFDGCVQITADRICRSPDARCEDSDVSEEAIACLGERTVADSSCWAPVYIDCLDV